MSQTTSAASAGDTRRRSGGAEGPDSRLRIRQLTIELPNGRLLLERSSVSVDPGRVVVVLGGSGAGKSTLGDVLFDLLSERAPGSRVTAAELFADEGRMALVLQRGSLFDHLSVAENIRFAARRTRGIKLSRAQVAERLAEVGIDRQQESVAGLSGGEERRVNVARALASEPAFIFFDEPTAGLDVANVRRIGALIREVCRARQTGVLVVTHDPLLAALVGDELLYLDRVETRLVPLLSDWRGPVSADDGERLARARASIERAVLERAEAEELSALGRTVAEHLREAGFGRRLAWLLGRLGRFLTAPGRVLRDLLAVLAKLPESVAHPRDFGRLSWHALRLTGYSGLPFFGLVAAIFSATFLSIAFAAAELVPPRVIVENLRGDFILALTPPLCGFLFAARSGSALTAWLGGLALRRQTDALRSLGVSIDSYLRVPAFVGSFVGFLLTTFVFGAAMYWSATVTAIGFDVPQAGELLRETGPSFRLQLIEKTLLYGVIVGIVGTHMGLLPKRRSGDVAKSITRTIILCTLAIVISELFFAIDLHG